MPSQPGVFYIGVNNGGVWKSTDYARTWNPIFDGQDTGSIGAIAVAPSDPNVVFVGSGEGLRRPDLSVGDGIYRSGDAGKTWTHLGLRDGQQISALAIDPRDSNRVFAAVMGHPYGPNAQRGLYRSIDGGASWQKVLGGDDDTGAASVVIDPNRPQVIYANLWASRNPPWRLLDVLQLYGKGGVFKSTDGGTTWNRLRGGLPDGIGRVGIDVSRTNSNRLYAWVNASTGCGIYRSDDAGATWRKMNSEERICGRGDDFSGITIDPTAENTVYVANTTTYRSVDGGRTWTGIKGAPGGDDYHTVWIDPVNPAIILLAADQGATLSVNRGATWSSWYNQPTAQFYHVITDDRFPYWVYGGQQESGSAEVISRSDDGAIWIKYWHPVGAEEYGYIAPDPLHPSIIYGGKATRYDERTHQTQDISPSYEPRKYRFDRTEPLVFNRVDKRTLYLGGNVIFATSNGGMSWRIISPDLTRPNPGKPPNLGAFASTPTARGLQRGVVFAIAPSYVDRNLIWAGTNDGWVWLTRDGGGHWTNVTPSGMSAWTQIAQIDGSHFDRNTAYVAANRFHLDDLRPYIYRTHDGGRHWQLIAAGLPADAPVDTVREDPLVRGLLYAGTERTVYVSFDDGDRWQPLQLNLPSTSIRDLVVHRNDLVVGTHGRSFWILDDVAPLRELARNANAVERTSAYLFAPADAYRMRRDEWTDTPLPPEEPAGKNPPDGAIVDYYLASDASRPVTLSIYDAAGLLVRRYSSADRAQPINPEITVPTYWVQPPPILASSAGMHRFVWNYRYRDPQAVQRDYPISAIIADTPLAPQGVLAMPGVYTAELQVGGHRYQRSFTLRMDPRVRTGALALRSQFALATRIAALMDRSYTAIQSAKRRRNAAAAARLAELNARLGNILQVVEGADAAPTAQALAVCQRHRGAVAVSDASRFGEPLEDELPADIREVYEKNREKIGFVPNVFRAYAKRPEHFRAFMHYHDVLMKGPGNLSRVEREAIVVAVSSENRCQYCMVAHGAALRVLSKDPVMAEQIGNNWRTARIPGRLRTILEFASRINEPGYAPQQAEIDELRSAGFSSDDIWDIAAIAAFFGFSNRMAGMMDMRPNDEFYAMGRLAAK